MGETIGFSNLKFHVLLTNALWTMYRNEKWTDIIFDCKGTKFPAHRVIVFMESPEIDVKSINSTCDVDPDIFKLVIEYIYKGRTTIRRDQVEEVRKAAEMLGLKSLLENIVTYNRSRLQINCSAINSSKITKWKLKNTNKLLEDLGSEIKADDDESNSEKVNQILGQNLNDENISDYGNITEEDDKSNDVLSLDDGNRCNVGINFEKERYQRVNADNFDHKYAMEMTNENLNSKDQETEDAVAAQNRSKVTKLIKKSYRFECAHCDYEGSRKDYYMKHMQTKHSTIPRPGDFTISFACLTCEFTSHDRMIVLEHRRKEHGKKEYNRKKKKEFKCPDCVFVSETHQQLGRHIQNNHSTDRPFACKQCDYKSKTSCDLAKHKRSHSQEKFECTVCGKCLKTKTNLIGHLKLHDPPDLARQKPHICRFCPYRSSRRDALISHMKRVHDFEMPKEDQTSNLDSIKKIFDAAEVEYLCILCDYKTAKHNLFTNHLAIKHQLDADGKRLEPKYKCPTCDFKGFSSQHLKSHVVQAHKKKSFCCELCDFATYNKTLLSYHIKGKHLDEKPYACEKCGLRFVTMGMLSRHALIHQGGEFQCPICNNSYTLKMYLRRHMRIMHDSNGPRFMCHMCAFKTRTQDALKQHISRMHNENKPARLNKRKKCLE